MKRDWWITAIWGIGARRTWPAEAYQAPKALTGSAIALDICRKAAFLFREMGLAEHAAFCEGIGARIRAGIRKKLIDPRTLVAAGDCQTSQAMLLYYGAYEPEERERAFAILVGQIEGGGEAYGYRRAGRPGDL